MASKDTASPSDSNHSLNNGMDGLHVNNNVSRHLTVPVDLAKQSNSDTVLTPYASFSDSVLSQDIAELPECSFLKSFKNAKDSNSDSGDDSQNESARRKKCKRNASQTSNDTTTAGDLATASTSNRVIKKVHFSFQNNGNSDDTPAGNQAAASPIAPLNQGPPNNPGNQATGGPAPAPNLDGAPANSTREQAPRLQWNTLEIPRHGASLRHLESGNGSSPKSVQNARSCHLPTTSANQPFPPGMELWYSAHF